MTESPVGIAKSAKVSVLAAAVWLAVPASAAANAGTPLLWLSLFHLTVGNALIGIVEGFVVGRLLRVPISKAQIHGVAPPLESATDEAPSQE